MLDCITWKPEKGTIVMILDRYGDSSPVFLQTEASFMWHSVNAYDKGDLTIADFVGYKHPDHVLGSDSPIVAAMRGEAGHFVYTGEIYRYVIDVKKKTLQQEVMFNGNYEWPAINLVHRCYPYRFLYVAAARKRQFFWSGISRFDLKAGTQESYFFDDGLYCSEPVFAPRPGVSYRPEDDGEPGWILTEVYNGNTKRSCLSIFIADRLADGPVATVHLRHHVPYSMHGFWYSKEQYERDSTMQ
jgi:all-trans-8'-apo-beta-carotenal 15,15'-oxygenase